MRWLPLVALASCWLLATWCRPAAGQSLEQRLLAEDPAQLAAAARQLGDASRGAVVFYQPYLACTKCHVAGDPENQLGPDLSQTGPEATDEYLVESVLQPSKVIKKGYEPVNVITVDGKTLTAMLVADEPDRLVLRQATEDVRLVVLPKNEIDDYGPSSQSIMPTGQVNQLTSRQQFLDLIRYLMEIRDGGPVRAKELEPSPSLYAVAPLPEYENQLDHAGMIADLDEESFRRGEEIYNRLCINCHGTPDQPGTLPTSRRFASEPLKNGSDPYSMYQTLTRGFGMMAAQTWMVPQQKYDVIHYIREAYLKPFNPSQYVPVNEKYLAQVPKGSTRGPEPSKIVPWQQMDYGPHLMATYEIPGDEPNFAYKGIAVRLDPGPGGVSQGHSWMLLDEDTLRVAAGWSGEGFIDWEGINFNGRHVVHPRLVGQVHFANPIGPGWANPQDGSFDDPRLRGRDGRPYGPLPRRWAHYRGLYHYGLNVIVSYTVGTTGVLEMPGVIQIGEQPVFTRTFHIGPRDRPMIMQVARHPHAKAHLQLLDPPEVPGWKLAEHAPPEDNAAGGAASAAAPQLAGGNGTADPAGPFGQVALLVPPREKQNNKQPATGLQLAGGTQVEVARPGDFDMTEQDFTIWARICTRRGGTIFAKTARQIKWVPNGKAFFVRGGRLVFDIGWVGAVQSKSRVADGRWHDVAATWDHRTGQLRLYIDGQLEGQRRLRPKKKVKGHIVRLAYTATDFPKPQTFFRGQMAEVRFYGCRLDEAELSGLPERDPAAESLVARWDLTAAAADQVEDSTGNGHAGKITRVAEPVRTDLALAAAVVRHPAGAQWQAADPAQLRLKIPAGDQPLDFTVCLVQLDEPAQAPALLASLPLDQMPQDLVAMTRGGPPRWPDKLTTTAVIGGEDGPLAVDVLTHPAENPWFCRMRLTGFDFLPGGDRAAVCSWDGSVWLVSGLSRLPRSSKELRSPTKEKASEDERPAAPQLTWQRIASGLFQPLGLKVRDGTIYVGCRDEIVALHDLNGDGETDFYENFNNDHQVTDHFHEFAMDLQTDKEGNFYYAKAGRHALPALVPHHGTLLRVSRDGSRTEIVANGFRAPNGVCVNNDGTWFLTDQEGHWTPKNRINWVRPGRYYGYFWGYHNVTDPSDEAMEQPVCWITNAFDRSPSEVLWVTSRAWGPLYGSLLNLSYGYGKVYVVPHERIGDTMQGGMCQLPLPQFPTGVMRGRFHPQDGQLYLCGMFAWGGDQQQPGGFYRVRYTGQPLDVPIQLHARKIGMQITFTDALDRQTATDPANYLVKVWSLRRSAKYGSDHYNEHALKVTAARLSQDGKTVTLVIPEIKPTWCMSIAYAIKDARGQPVNGAIHNTVHQLGP